MLEEEKSPPLSYDLAAKFMDDTKLFSWGFKQDFFFFLSYLSEKKIDLNLAIRCIKYRMDYETSRIAFREERMKEWKEKALKCPECGKPMNLYSVNTKPESMIGDGYRTQWHCQWCDFSDFSKRLPAEWIRKLKIRGFVTERDFVTMDAPPKQDYQD